MTVRWSNVLFAALTHSITPMPRLTSLQRLGLGILALGAAACVGTAVPGSAQQVPRAGQGQPVMVPEFPEGSPWLNTEKPLTLRGLRGKVVLLDFWTYGCINCMHILPDLKRLERKYPNELVIISVHTAKFVNEDETQNIRSAALRYKIEHPILNDAGRKYWTTLGIGIWPTQVLVDPTGAWQGSVTGEGHYDEVDKAIARVIREAKAAGTLNDRPISFALEAAKTPSAPLSFPGKVLADTNAAGEGRLYIADSGHNRIVIANAATGEVEAIAGSGAIGRQDGAFDQATFSNPQGMALRKAADGSVTLLVADTNNHLIRSLDLKKGTVTTIAGTGKQASVVRKSPGGMGTSVSLASPWDLLVSGSSLYIAMAGPHQIWVMNLDSGSIRPYAGSGQEAKTDGNLLSSAFAQPSGLASDGKRLFVADSESSTIRSVELPGQGGRVITLAGGTNLFDFGDKDGPGSSARLQHPLGVAYGTGVVYLTDTYNHKVKQIDLSSGNVTTFAGGGRGSKDGAQAQFYEPGGLSLSANRLYIADTNNHAIRMVDTETRATSTLTLKNLPRPLPSEPDRSPQVKEPESNTQVAAVSKLAPGAAGELVVEVKLPAGHKLNPGSPQRFTATVEGAGATLAKSTVPTAEFTLPLRVPLTAGAAGSKGAVVVAMTVFYCSEKDGTCKMKTLKLRAPYEVAEGGGKAVTVGATLQ